MPITDMGKKSKRGRLVLIKDAKGTYSTYAPDSSDKDYKDELVTVFKNGVITKEYTFEECRSNTNL